jgi:protein-tyrosine-phosphatase/predicted ATP-grasp superfamily ATP-dependent carboligase
MTDHSTRAWPPVLVFGDDTRSFLATVRSLGRRGVRVHVAPFSLQSPALRSRHVAKVHHIPYHLGDGAEWLAAVQQVVHAEGIGVIVACEERSMLPLMRHRDALPGCQFALPSDAAFDAFFDKLKTHALAQQVGVTSPDAVAVEPGSQARQIGQQLGFPVVCKARRSYDWPQLYGRTKVSLAHDEEALGRWLTQCGDARGQYLAEAYFDGFGLGVSVLCDQGRVVQAFEHHRVNELEGSSYYRVSSPVHPERLAAVARMVEAVAYTGLAMFEFKHQPATGRWALLEVNARPWGSMPLPVALGVDFPWGAYLLALGQPAPPAVTYAEGVLGRHLMGDLHQLRMRLAGLPRWQGLGHGLRWVAGLARALTPREHWDTLVADDPRPGLAELAELRRAGWQRLLRLVGRANHSANPQGRALLDSLGRAKAGAAPPRILFLCLGNICRSPYAELRARALAQAAKRPVIFGSAGTLPREPRPSPAAAQAAAARRGLALDAHRSQHASPSTLAGWDAIVSFDGDIVNALLARRPELQGKLVHIDAYGAAGDIADPYGCDAATFDRTYEAIDRALNAWPLLQPNPQGPDAR